jgi:hypothetical protein
MAKVDGRDRMAQRIDELRGDGTDWQVRMHDVTFVEQLILKRGNKEPCTTRRRSLARHEQGPRSR